MYGFTEMERGGTAKKRSSRENTEALPASETLFVELMTSDRMLNTTVKARFWPRLSGKCAENHPSCYRYARRRMG